MTFDRVAAGALVGRLTTAAVRSRAAHNDGRAETEHEIHEGGHRHAAPSRRAEPPLARGGNGGLIEPGRRAPDVCVCHRAVRAHEDLHQEHAVATGHRWICRGNHRHREWHVL